MTSSERHALEDLLRERFESARKNYRVSVEVAKMLKELSHDAPSPDGELMRSQASAAQEHCLKRYIETLSAFTGLVVYNQVPQEFGRKEAGREQGNEQARSETA